MNDEKSTPESGDKSWLERIAHAFSSEPKTRQDLGAVLEVALENEVIDPDVHGIMEGAIVVADMQARDIMVQRSHMKVIKHDATLDEILPEIIKTSHSRYPVIGENPDDLVGILLAKDLLPQILEPERGNFSLASLLRPAPVVPESKRLNVLLREFRENRNHMAIVIDEYGCIAGLVTIEDVLEEIVGEIEDETDLETDAFIRQLADGTYLVRALTPIDDFNEQFGVEFSDDEFDTIGGLIMHEFGRLPGRNETTVLAGFEFKVLNANQRMIHSLRVRALDD